MLKNEFTKDNLRKIFRSCGVYLKSLIKPVICLLIGAIIITALVTVTHATYDNDTNRPSDPAPWYNGNQVDKFDVRYYGQPAYNADRQFGSLAFDYYDDLYEWGYLPYYVVAIGVNLNNGTVQIAYPLGVTDVTTTTVSVADSVTMTLKFVVTDRAASGSRFALNPVLLDGVPGYGSYGAITPISGSYSASGGQASFGTSNGIICWYFRDIVNGVPTDFAITAAEDNSYPYADDDNYNVSYARLMIEFGDFLRSNLDGDIIVEEVVNETIVSEEIDIGSFLTSYMQAGRILFDGWFGFEIFGINVASTLISILVVAIVIWIVKHLRGD